jgi:hypothetical protein
MSTLLPWTSRAAKHMAQNGKSFWPRTAVSKLIAIKLKLALLKYYPCRMKSKNCSAAGGARQKRQNGETPKP